MRKVNNVLGIGGLLSAVLFLTACPDTQYEVGVFKPFHVLSVTPAGGAENIPLEPIVTVTFSDDLLESTLTDRNLYLLDTTTGDHVPADLTYDDNGEAGPFVVTFGLHPGLPVDPTPDDPSDSPLGFSRLYEIHVTTGLLREAKPDRPLEQIDESGLNKEVVSSFRAEDPPPLQVLSVEPAGGTEEAPINAAVRIRFSEAVDRASVSTTSFAVADITDWDPSGAVAGTFAFADSDATTVLGTGDIVVFTPALDFGFSRDVEVRLSTALQSTRATDRGGNLTEAVTLGFSTRDPPALTFVASVPEAGADDVPLDATITLDFSEALDPGRTPPAVDSILVQDVTAGTTMDIAGTWALATHTVPQDRLNFVPDLDFAYAATILVTLTTDVQSARATPRGGQLAGEIWIPFATLPPPSLHLVNVTPEPGNQRVDSRVSLSMTFDMPVATSSVNATTIQIEDVELGQPVSGAFNVADEVVTFVPAGDEFRLDATVTVLLTTNIQSIPAYGGGTLSQPVAFSFHITPAPPLEVEAFTPVASGGVAVDVAPTVTFNTALFEATLPTGAIAVGSSDAHIRVGTCPAASPCACNLVNTVAGVIAYDPETRTATFTPDIDLAGDTTYELCASTGVISYVGNPLLEELRVVFTTEADNQVAFTEPGMDAIEVAVTSTVRVYLDPGISPNLGSVEYGVNFRLAYVDPFGREALVVGTVATGSDGTHEYFELVPDQDVQPCGAASQLLLYDTTYTLTLTEDVHTGASDPLTDGYSFSFTTTSPPYVVASAPEDNEVGFPVVEPFVVSLSGRVDAATLTMVNVTLADSGSNPVPLTSIEVDAGDTHTLVVTPDWSSLADGHLLFDEVYTLTLHGGPGGAPAGDLGLSVEDDAGQANYLLGDQVFVFTTATEPVGVLAPAADPSTVPQNTTIAVVFDRPMEPSTFTEDRFKVVDCGAGCDLTPDGCTVDDSTPSLVGLRSQTDDKTAVVFIPLPELPAARTYVVAIAGADFGGSPVTDIWGNPLDNGFRDAFCSIAGSVNTGPIANLVAPVDPVAADAEVVIGFNKDVSPDGVTCAGLFVRETATATNLCRKVVYDAANQQAHITVAEPVNDFYLQGGTTYEAGVTGLIADLQFNLTEDLGVQGTFTVESTPPTISSVVPNDAATEVAGGAVIVISFNEPMRQSSFVVGTTIWLTDGDDNPIGGIVTTDGNDVIFAPAALLPGDKTYTLHLSGVTDLGGAALVADPYTTSFTTDTVSPIVSGTPAFMGDDVVVTFSEAMDPSRLVSSTVATPGNIRLFSGACPAAGAEIHGCMTMDAAEVLFSPRPNPDDASAVLANGDYCLVITTAATDLAGLPLADELSTTVTR